MSETGAPDTSQEQQFERWELPAIDGTSTNGYLTAAGLQALQKQAWDEAYAAGQSEGLQAGAEEIASRAARFDELLVALAEPFDRLDDSVETQLVELSMTVVKQLFRREIKIDPTHIIGVVREAIKVLPVASRSIQVHLHPQDALLVNEALSPAGGERAWSTVEDPLLQRGGCKITTENSQIDAQVETRLNTIIAAISGDSRKTDPGKT